MLFPVPPDVAAALRRPKGSNVTIVNQSATDVYFDQDPNRVLASLAGTIPSGTKLAANGGQIQYASFPGVLWFRAQFATQIEVTP